MASVKPFTIAARLEATLAADFRALCEIKHIAPSTMLRVLIHRYVEECGLQPDPLEIVDALAKANQARKPGVKRTPKAKR